MKFSKNLSSLKIVLLTLIIVMFYQISAFAAVDMADSVQALQSKIDIAMKSRLTSYEILYTGNFDSVQSNVTKAINAIYDNDDYQKYTSKGYSYSYTYSDGVASIKFTFDYWNTKQMDDYVTATEKQILSTIITPGMNDYQKEKAIHDWIEANVSYDTTLTNHSDYNGLVAPYKTVCQGYALLAYKMLNQVGIETKIVEGKGNGQAHAWNLVHIDGAWYHLDTTWDDTENRVNSYNYYNLTDEQMKITHTWTKSYPTANTLFSNVVKK